MRGGGRLLAAACVGLLGLVSLAACGDDDDGGSGDGGAVSAEAKPYVDALATSMTQSDESGIQRTDAEADCLAPKFVDTIGVDTLKAKGITPEDLGEDSGGGPDLDELGLTSAQGEALVNGFGACDIDLKAIFLKGFSEDGEASEEDMKCLEENFPEDLVNKVMVVSLTQGDDAMQNDQELMGQLLAVFSKCPGAVPAG